MIRNKRNRLSYEEVRKLKRQQIIHGVIFFTILFVVVGVLSVYAFGIEI